MMLFNQMLDGRFNRFLRSMFLDEQAGVETLAPELQPIFVAEGDRIEHRLLKGERLYAGIVSNTAGVGTDVFLQLLNPGGSNQLVVIEEIWLNSTLAQQINLLTGVDAPIGALASANAHLDRRPQNLPLTNACAVQLRSLVAAGPIGNNFATIQLLAGTQVFLRRREGFMVLGPGRALTLQSTIDSAGLVVTFLWSERGVRPSELG